MTENNSQDETRQAAAVAPGTHTVSESPPHEVAQRVRALLLQLGGKRLSARAELEIRSYGAQAIPPLIAVLEDRELAMTDAPGQGQAPIDASRLLAELQAEQAIEPMLRALEESEPMEVIYNQLLHDLKLLGEPVLAPALAAYEQAAGSEYRSTLCSVIADTGGKDDRVLDILLGQLAREPDLGASNLGQYGDPRALPHLSRALDDFQVLDTDNPFANHTAIELREAIEILGGKLSTTQKKKLRQALKPEDAWRERLNGALGGVPEHASDSEKVRRKLGRNERCWCGSGKKYKKCHLRQDEESGRSA